MTPSPEQGTSARTASKVPSQPFLGFLASATWTEMLCNPNRSAPAWMRAFLWGWRSQETISPISPIAMAAAKDFPPGAAQASSTRLSGVSPAASTASRAAGSWG